MYNWLNRSEERGFKAALYDDSPLGRPSQFSDDQFGQFAAVLYNLPKEAGYDTPARSTAFAQQYLIEAFDVALSCRHVGRVTYKAEVSPKRPQPEPVSAHKIDR